MKRFIFVLTLSLFYLAACTNSDANTHDEGTHTHDGSTHSHDDDHNHADDHDHEHGHSHEDGHDHDHEQEEFSVEADSLKQDSLNNKQ